MIEVIKQVDDIGNERRVYVDNPDDGTFLYMDYVEPNVPMSEEGVLVELTRTDRDALVEALNKLTFTTWHVDGDIRAFESQLRERDVDDYRFTDMFVADDRDDAVAWAGELISAESSTKGGYTSYTRNDMLIFECESKTHRYLLRVREGRR